MGAVNTGALDDLREIHKICHAHSIWFHVDAAFGAWASLSESHAHLKDQLKHADSLVFDLHKWMYQSYDLGCVMVRDPAIHTEALRTSADYIAPIEGTISDAPYHLSSRAIQLSRGFKALKLWFSLKAEGVSAFAAAISKNLALAQYLTEQVEAHPHLELLAPTTLHIVNFRYVGEGGENEALDQVNISILQALHQSGFAIPSSTILNGKFSLRICISNHRTEQADIDNVLGRVIALGEEAQQK